jgi:hypothetical protein
MSKRVIDVIVENCILTVKYSDCTSVQWSIANCGDPTPVPKQPGDWPPPDPVEDVRCRVAIKVGEQAAARLNNYLSGLILTGPVANLPALYSAAKIAEYGWPISLYDAMFGFYWDGVFGGGTPGNDAKIDWDANSATITAEVQEALYCILPESGEITETTVELWVGVLNGMGTEFHTLLAALLLIWPLAQLREMAFNASTTTDAVDCEAFACSGAPSGDPCSEVDMDWSAVTTTPAPWENIPGIINMSGWSGDTEYIDSCGIAPNTVDYTASRVSNGNWIRTGAANTCLGISLRYTPDAPCIITHAQFSFSKNSPNSIGLGIVARRASDGAYVVLKSESRPAIQPLSGAFIWTGAPIAVSEVLFFVHSGINSGTFQIQMTENKVNSP